MDEVFRLCDIVRQTSFEIHKYLRYGHLEKIYENALAHRLRKLGLNVEQQYPLSVMDEDTTVLGEYFTDLFVDRQLIVEIKAVREIHNDHLAQIIGYLRATRIQHGILVNFGGPKLQVRKLFFPK